MQFTFVFFFFFYTYVTLAQGQGHKAWYKSVDPKQCYNHAELERPRLNSTQEKANIKGFVRPLILEGM